MIALAFQYWPELLTAVLAVFGAWRLRQSGVNAERARQAKDRLAAAEERLEMDREATEIEREVTGLSDDKARGKAMSWTKP